MVIGETNPTNGAGQVAGSPAILQEKIDNIMGGISNTGAVKMNNHRKKLRQRFDIIKKLGQGTYGKVQLGINKETGQEVAIKTIKKCKIEAESDLIRIRREVQIMSSVQHPNIIHIYEVFENREKMVLVMEFAAGGELYDYLSERKVLAEDEARRIFRQVATAVYYCHKHKICHRDLKLENILLDEHGNAKIADFGLSNVFDDQRLLATYCGSPLYASPEIVKGTPYQGPEVDCWSLGVLLYTLVYGAMPFDGSQFKRLVKQISQGDYYEPKKPSPASPLIREMLTVCPERRANIEQICNHWWVNEGYNESCLDVAEDLANQTPVRLDVLLSLSPVAVTADQLVVPSGEDGKLNERVARSHSVGSIRDIGNTEAERRILDMVAAGGEAALMPSPTRTITPTESPIQIKRKLENTVSTENAVGIVKKKERHTEKGAAINMEVDPDINVQQASSKLNVPKDLEAVEIICEELIEDPPSIEDSILPRQRTITKLDAVNESDETAHSQEISPTKVIKKFVNKHKTADLVEAINKMTPDKNDEIERSRASMERKSSLPDENLPRATDRRRTRILETAEKLQNLNNSSNDKPKKIVIPGTSVGNFKKEFERKASETTPIASSRLLENQQNESMEKFPDDASVRSSIDEEEENSIADEEKYAATDKDKASTKLDNIGKSESKNSLESFSLKEARRSMENSIALLNQARDESSKEVDQLCAKTENIAVTPIFDREKKLKNAREIIGNAIQPGGRLCMGVRKPPVPFGLNGRSISGSVVPPMNTDKKSMRIQAVPEPSEGRNVSVTVSTPEKESLSKASSKVTNAQLESSPPPSTVKTSRAEITLKSATLPRRKPAKTEIQLEIKPRKTEQPMRFSTEMQHQVPDLRSAPIREGPSPYSPIPSSIHQRATSLEPTLKERVIPIQRPSAYSRSGSNSLRSGSLSRQSTIESDTDTTTAQSQSTITTGSSQPIKKSPREFIIPIAVEGGGYVTPRAGSLEPSDSSHTTSSATFSRINRPRRVGSLLTEGDSEEDSPFHKIRTASINRDIDSEEPRFTMHRLRSTRPIKKMSQDSNDSQSSGEDDDEDGFEILTAENLFSTLLQRVRALTNRLNVNNDITAGFPNSSRLLGNMRQAHSPFWQQEPFGRLNSNSGAASAWRHSLSRDLGSDIDSMFSRTGATLPRGSKKDKNQQKSPKETETEVALDLADLDLSRLRLTKKDLETLSTITPNLPKCFQDQLLAKLPPTQARKLSRTLSMQNNTESSSGSGRVYKRSLSGGRELSDRHPTRHDEKSCYEPENEKELEIKSKLPDERSLDRNCRKSMSREKYGYEATPKTRCSITSKTGDDYNKSLCSSYTSDVSDRYKYYSPYLTKRSDPDRPLSPYLDKESDLNRSISPYKCYESSMSPRNSCFSPLKEAYGRPPSGCLSPQPIIPDSSLRRRSSQRRISRFLRPDFFEVPVNEENAYLREKKLRERETQNVLREIREKSRDRSRDRRNHSVERVISSKDNLESVETNVSMRHIRNKSMDRFVETPTNQKDDLLVQRRRRSISKPRELVDENPDSAILPARRQSLLRSKAVEEESKEDHIRPERRRSISKPRELVDGNSKCHDNSEIANKILEELQNISLRNNISKVNHIEGSSVFVDNAQEKVIKVKKVKSKDSTIKKEKKLPNVSKQSSSSERQIESKSPSDDKIKKESKLIRPKSYPIKEPEKSSSTHVKFEGSSTASEKEDVPKEVKAIDEMKEKSRISRPKSYPNSKITQPKEIQKFSRSGIGISAVMEKLMEKAEKPAVGKKASSKSSSSEEKQLKPSNLSAVTESKTIKKIAKTSKKPKSVDTKPSAVEKSVPTESPVTNEVIKKEKSPEKKVSKGFLYAIGQKFKNLQENAKNKEKKAAAAIPIPPETPNVKDADVSVTLLLKNKKIKPNGTTEIQSNGTVDEILPKVEEKLTKADKRSRIDAMIRSLRERSVPRAPVLTESGLIKRAVSVEDLSGTFNKCGVNKVLGLFKKYEKDDTDRKVMNTRSTSNIERHISNIHVHKERPKSGGFIGKLRKNTSNNYEKPKDEAVRGTNKVEKQLDDNGTHEMCPLAVSHIISAKEPCQDCVEELKIEARKRNAVLVGNDEQEKSKEKRKGLLLDFSKLDNSSNKVKAMVNNNHQNKYSPLSFGTLNNNNSFIGNNYEINQNTLLTPSNDNMTNYSSSSKSPYDDCPSSSTFLSPSEEPELCFDNWSVCSEDNYMVSTPSPTVSRLSRASQFSSPVLHDTNNPESVIDRIKRRSFYTRFNEKKPKRQSNIVGPAARDYYRESAAKLRSRPPDRISSPEIDTNTIGTNEYLRPLKLNSNPSDLKPPHIHVRRRYEDEVKRTNPTSNDYLKPRSTYNDIVPSVNAMSNRYVENDHIRRYEPSYSSGLYNTYNPKRRSSFTSNGIVPGSMAASSDRMANIDGYATLGRLLYSTQNTAKSPSVGAFRRDHQRVPVDFGNIPKSNLNLRNSSVSRSPTNI